MSKAALNTMVRVFKSKIAQGKSFEEIVLEYPKLSPEDIEAIREALR